MAFKDVWKPRIDGVDDANSSAVNEIAEAVIENEKAVKKNASDILNKQDALSQEQLQNINDVPNKATKATTLEGYGITDAYTKTEVDTKDSALKDDISELKQKSIPHTTVSDYPISVSDHLEGESVINYKVYGNSVQDGTPTPETPVEIQSVGDLITDETSEYYGKYDVPVVIHGKNLFDTERWYNELYAIETSHTGDYAISKTDEYIQLCAALGKYNLNFMEGEFETNTQYSISMQIMNVTANNTAGLIIKYTDGTVLNISALKTDTSWKDISVVTSEGKTISCIVINSYSLSTIFRIKNIQFEKGTTATSYEPYASETKHIYLNEPLRKVGDYADYLYYKDKKLMTYISMGVIDETASIGKFSAQNTISDFYVKIPNLDIVKPTTGFNTPILSPTFESYSDGKDFKEYQIRSSIVSTDKRICFTLPNTISTVEECKEWLKENPIIFYYPLATPTEESITVPELTAPNSELMHISSGTATQPSQIDLTYYQDINKVITNLTNAVLAQGGNV